MPFDFVQMERVLLVSWLGVPTMTDVKRLSNVVARASREVRGSPLTYIAVVRMGAMPSAEVRSAMVATLKEQLESLVETIDMVMLSPGIVGAMQRTIVRAMSSIAGLGKKFFIHQSTSSALVRLRTALRDPALLARIRRELETRVDPGDAADPN